MEIMKKELLKRIPSSQRKYVEWFENEDTLSTEYFSNQDRYMCVAYDKRKKKIRNFSLA